MWQVYLLRALILSTLKDIMSMNAWNMSSDSLTFEKRLQESASARNVALSFMNSPYLFYHFPWMCLFHLYYESHCTSIYYQPDLSTQLLYFCNLCTLDLYFLSSSAYPLFSWSSSLITLGCRYCTVFLNINPWTFRKQTLHPGLFLIIPFTL